MRERRHVETGLVQPARPGRVVGTLRQESHDIHPAVGVAESDRQASLREELEEEGLARGVLAPATTHVGIEGAALEKERQRRLIEQRQVVVVEMLERDEALEQRFGHHDVAEPQRGKEELAERAGVDDPAAVVQALQTGQRTSAVA